MQVKKENQDLSHYPSRPMTMVYVPAIEIRELEDWNIPPVEEENECEEEFFEEDSISKRGVK